MLLRTDPFRALDRRAPELAYPRCVAEFADRAAAERAVDRLVREGLPAHEIALVGRGVRSVERVFARARWGASARFGASVGAWCGLLFALPLLLAGDARGFTVPFSAALLGALVGLLCATVEHRVLTRFGGRSFAPAPVELVADRYEVQVEHRSAERARELLAQQWPPIPRPLAGADR